MDIDCMKYYGLNKEFDKADYLEMPDYQKVLTNIPHAVKLGGLIAVTGIVGIGKTVALRQLQHALRTEKQIVVSKSFATDRRRVSINTLYTALFTDLATKKDGCLPTQAEKRER